MAQREHNDPSVQLRSREGHFEMASFDIERREQGYWMWVACDFDGHKGGHWIAPDPSAPERLTVASDPYLWPSAVEAFAARDRWIQQESR